MSDLIVFFISYSEEFTYAAIFLILFACGLGLPLPEEITLLASGFLIQLGLIRPYPTLAVGFVGVLTGDLAMYSIGRRWGQGIITHQYIRKVFSESRVERARRFFGDHGNKTIFIARFISGFRVAAFLAAGTMGMRMGQFLFLDFLGAIITIPLLLFLGFYFGMNITWLAEFFTRIDLLLKIALVILAAAALAYFLCKRGRK